MSNLGIRKKLTLSLYGPAVENQQRWLGTISPPVGTASTQDALFAGRLEADTYVLETTSSEMGSNVLARFTQDERGQRLEVELSPKRAALHLIAVSVVAGSIAAFLLSSKGELDPWAFGGFILVPIIYISHWSRTLNAAKILQPILQDRISRMRFGVR